MDKKLLEAVKKQAHQVWTGPVGEIVRAPIVGLRDDQKVVFIIVRLED